MHTVKKFSRAISWERAYFRYLTYTRKYHGFSYPGPNQAGYNRSKFRSF